MTPSILAQIADQVRARLEERRKRVPMSSLRASASARTRACAELKERKPYDLGQALKKGQPGIIAEVKFRSPSEGMIYQGACDAREACAIGESYARAGAAAVSILTEPDHFAGSLDFLQAVRMKLPHQTLLMKDFIIDEYQLYEGYVHGADAVLLIMALLDFEKARALHEAAISLGLSVLTEVHNEFELNQALKLNAKIIGVNNRDLSTLQTSLETSRRLISLIPKSCVAVCESGLQSGADIKAMAKIGFSGFLIGTSLMKTQNPGDALSHLMEELR